MSDHATTVLEKAASIPPAAVFLTSITGLIDWQTVFYIVSIVWVLVQMGFFFRKEWKLRQNKPGDSP